MVTNHGKPIALMIPVTSDDFDETIDLVNQVEAMRALARIQAAARRKGSADMGLAEIDGEIAKARRTRAGRGRATRRP